MSVTLQQATANPRLHQTLLETHGQFLVNLLWGQCSFLLGHGAHRVLFVPSKSLFPQPCVSSGGSMVGSVVTSSKRAFAISSHWWPVPPLETLKHSFGSVSVGCLGPGEDKVCLSPLCLTPCQISRTSIVLGTQKMIFMEWWTLVGTFLSSKYYDTASLAPYRGRCYSDNGGETTTFIDLLHIR